jgi:hypothetical protein
MNESSIRAVLWQGLLGNGAGQTHQNPLTLNPSPTRGEGLHNALFYPPLPAKQWERGLGVREKKAVIWFDAFALENSASTTPV